MSQITPCEALRSILQLSPATPSEKLQGALKLLHRQSLADLARVLGCSYRHLTEVALGTRKSASLQRRIADYLGVEPSDIWSVHRHASTLARGAGRS